MNAEQKAETLRLADYLEQLDLVSLLRTVAAEQNYAQQLGECTGAIQTLEREVAYWKAKVGLQSEPFAWAVCSINSDSALSLEYTAPWEEAAHDHIFDAIKEDIEGAGSWVVRPLYLHPAPAQTPLTEKELLGAIARGWCSTENEKKEMDSDLALAIFKEVRSAIEQALAQAHEAGVLEGATIRGFLDKPAPDAQPVAWVVFVGNEKMKAFDTLRDAEDWARNERRYGSGYVYHIRTAYTQPVEQSPEQPANLR